MVHVKLLLPILVATVVACGESPTDLLHDRDAGLSGTSGADGGIGDAAVGEPGTPPLAPDHDGGTATPPEPDASAPPGEEDAAAPPDPPPDPPPQPRGPATLMIMTANVENLPQTSDGCPGDWRDLFYYLELQPTKPDLVFVQQLTDQAQLDQLTAYMTQRLGRPYAGVIAEENPRPFNSPCGAQKERQTNAVVYASDRLSAVGERQVWQSYKNVDGACVRDGLSRTHSVAQTLRDVQTAAELSVASIHWSTRNGAGADPACAAMNVAETANILRTRAPAAELVLFGGDTNEPEFADGGGFNGWYTSANRSLGGPLQLYDPIYEVCGGAPDCLRDNWTFRGASSTRRIDYLFAGGPGAVAVLGAHTVTFNEGNAADTQVTGSDNDEGYSDHRAVWSQVRY